MIAFASRAIHMATPVAVPVATPMGQPVAVAVAAPVATAQVAVTQAPPPTRQGDMMASSIGPNKWSIDLCDCCCKGKGVCTFVGCCNECWCGSCIYSSAISKSGIDPLNTKLDENMRCVGFCCGMFFEVFPCQSQLLRTIARLEIAKKYQIQEDAMHAFCVTCCCPCCADGQVQNEIMVQMNLKHSCACVVPEQMER